MIELLASYRDALDGEREKAKAAAAAALGADAAILARLAECDLIPNPLRKIAQGIEYPTALGSAAAKVEKAYEKAAGEEVEPLYQAMSRYVGAANQPDHPELARHGTLHDSFYGVRTALDTMEGPNSTTGSGSRVARTRSTRPAGSRSPSAGTPPSSTNASTRH